MKEHGIEQAEYCDRHSDATAQNKYRNSYKARLPLPRAKGVSDVLPQMLHGAIPPGRCKPTDAHGAVRSYRQISPGYQFRFDIEPVNAGCPSFHSAQTDRGPPYTPAATSDLTVCFSSFRTTQGIAKAAGGLCEHLSAADH